MVRLIVFPLVESAGWRASVERVGALHRSVDGIGPKQSRVTAAVNRSPAAFGRCAVGEADFIHARARSGKREVIRDNPVIDRCPGVREKDVGEFRRHAANPFRVRRGGAFEAGGLENVAGGCRVRGHEHKDVAARGKAVGGGDGVGGNQIS